jgi:putative peptide zinc metalloprotease protein
VTHDTTKPEIPDGSRFTRIAEIHVTLRSDLHVSRQLQEGCPVYVIHDPVGFRSHRLTQQDYEVATRLSDDLPLGIVFDELVKSGTLESEDEEDFYSFVSLLHKLSLVSMPGQDGAKYFDAWQAKKRKERKNRLIRFLFIRVPLADPDRFLSRAAPFMRFLFTRGFAFVWLLAVVVTIGFLVTQWRMFLEPLNDYLALDNLPLLWTALVVLKIWHELGHGFACRIFGGKVPEMGVLLLGGNPAAYVDATAAWSFERRRHRLIVMLGGMYFESLAAIVAVYVWAFASDPMLVSWAHYVVTLSTATTILFNANPLMRFDGYFIFSELIGIQNLRPRSVARVKAAAKRIFLGLPDNARHDIPLRRRGLLMSYGVASSIYKATVMLAIAVAFSMRFPVVGLALGAYFFGITVGGSLYRLGRYLLRSEDVRPVQRRARCVFGLLFVALPLVSFFVPVPFGICSEGLLGAETEHRVHAGPAGELNEVHVEPGHSVIAGDRLITLVNPELNIAAHIAHAGLQQARRNWDYLQGADSVEAARLEARVRSQQLQFENARDTLSGLTVSSSGSGTVARIMIDSEPGRFVKTGEPVLVVVQGPSVVRTWLTEEQLDRISPQPGMNVEIRLASQPWRSCRGRVLNVRPVTDDLQDELALTQFGGGAMVVREETGQPVDPLFAVEIAPSVSLDLMQFGTRASVKFDRTFEPVALWAFRRCLRFVHRTLLS